MAVKINKTGNKMLYIIKKNYFLSDYILDAIKDQEDVRIILYKRLKPKGTKRILQKIKRFIRSFVCNKRGLWIDDFFSETFLSEIKDITPNDNVLFWGCENLKELLILSKEITSKVKNVFFWNPVSSINRNFYSKWECAHYLHHSGMQVFTFDKGDAIKYGFQAINQVYRKPKAFSCKQLDIPHTDIFYIGVDKHRTAILKMLKEEFDKDNISYSINIKKDKHSVAVPQLESCYIDKLVPYEDALNMIRQSDCILEILQKKQSGMTLRTLEAVFLGKKLITNNKEIINSPIYFKNNIYIIDNNEQRTIKEFIQTPMMPIPSAVIDSFDIEHWITPFLYE